jgi:hypothetical protein
LIGGTGLLHRNADRLGFNGWARFLESALFSFFTQSGYAQSHGTADSHDDGRPGPNRP